MRNKTIIYLIIGVIFSLGYIYNVKIDINEVQAETSDDNLIYGDFEYCINDDNEITIIKYLGDSEEVEIPEKIDDISVTVIGGSAFYNNMKLENVTIPSSVKKIGGFAFAGCKNLSNVKLPSSLTTIEEYAFYYCEEFTNIEIPSNVKKIGTGAFCSCANLSQVNIPPRLTTIGIFVFSRCDSLISMDIPSNITNIDNYAFWESKALERIRIPASVTSIGHSVLSGCTSLKAIYTEEGSYAEEFFRNFFSSQDQDVNFNYMDDDDSFDDTYYFTSTKGICSRSNLSNLLWNSGFKTYSDCITSTKMIIPGIIQTNQGYNSRCCNMVPQGICATNDYILISAYCHDKEHKSVIYVMDKNSTKYLTTILLSVENNKGLKKGNHVGGLAYGNDTVYIAGSSDEKIWKLPYGEVKNAVNSGNDVYEAIIGKTAYVDINNTPIDDKASFVFWDESYQKLFVGYFDSDRFTDFHMHAYNDDGSFSSEKIQLPINTQGVSFGVYNGKTYCICSCSYNSAKSSSIYVAELKKPNNACGYILTNWKMINAPNMSEDIHVDGGIMYNCFESAANYYTSKGHMKTAFDRIPYVNVHSLIASVLKNGKSVSVNKSINANRKISNKSKLMINSAGILKNSGQDESDEEDIIVNYNDNIKAKGICGKNTNYCLYADGNMLISGQGDMFDYSDNSAPWENFKDNITSVFIDMGVSCIGEYAFYNCSKLNSVTISEFTNPNIKFTIKKNAFGNCTNLDKVSLPDIPFDISDEAFSENANILLESNSTDVNAYTTNNNNCILHTHQYKFKTKVNPTCMEDGYDIYECSCGKEVINNIVKTTKQHQFVERTRVDATKESEGYILYECEHCINSYSVTLEYDGSNDDVPTPTPSLPPIETPTSTPSPIISVPTKPSSVPSGEDVVKPNTTPSATPTHQPNVNIKVPSKPTLSSVKNLKGKKAKIKWKKTKGATGYEVQYALNKKFTKSRKTKTLKSTSLTIKKLKKKTYYVRVRAYTTNSSGIKVYSKWSKIKKVKIKK